ncbi:unnamed protein product [Closterium sp. NIES-53]
MLLRSLCNLFTMSFPVILSVIHAFPLPLSPPHPPSPLLSLEYWSFDIVTLLAGLLPNPDIQVAGLSVVLNTSVMAFVLPYGFGVAVSTRVANELGAGDEIAAQRAATVGVLWALFEATLVSSALLTVRSSWGCVFSTSPEVVAFVAAIMPLLVASVVTDAVNAVLSGIVRGSGYQQVALVANLAAYYLFGLPLAALLAFYLKLGSVGLWSGLTIGTCVQLISIAVIMARMDWSQAVDVARERVESSMSMDDKVTYYKNSSNDLMGLGSSLSCANDQDTMVVNPKGAHSSQDDLDAMHILC